MMDSDKIPPPGGTLSRGMPQTETNHLQIPFKDELLPEERDMYKKCEISMIFKAGLPFAVFCHILSKFLQNKGVKQVTQQNPHKSKFMFIGNVLIGSLLSTPVCLTKLRIMHDANLKKRKELMTSSPAIEGVSTSSTPEDFSYPNDLISGLNEPESSFSLDFSPSSLLDNEEDKKLLSTTYKDLRAKHRSDHSLSNKEPSLSLNIGPEHELGPLAAVNETPPPSKSPPQKVVKRNKYGDEIE